MNRGIKKISILSLLLTVFCADAFAVGSSGFELATNSSRSLARGNAVTADPGEPAAVVFNPAGLVALEGNQISASSSIITLSTEYSGKNGGVGEDSATLMSTVPSVFMSFSTPIDALKIGAGVNAPFGLATEWKSDKNFKYLGNYNQIKSVGYNISAAYKIRPGLSVGAGFTYLDTDLKQVGKINSNLIALNATGFNFGAPDSPYELDVNGNGIGYNLGLQINHEDKHFLGLFYRSQVHAGYKGEFSANNFQDPVTQSVFGGTAYNTTVKTHVTFPGSVTLAYKYQVNEKWDVESDFTWTQWSRFDRLDIDFANSNAILQAFTPVSEDFKDVLSLNLGSSYKLNTTWIISGGYFYYQRAANKATYSNAIPDGDHHGFSLGVTFSRPAYSINLSYIAEFLPSVAIDNNVGLASNAVVDGDYSSFVNILSVDVLHKF